MNARQAQRPACGFRALIIRKKMDFGAKAPDSSQFGATR
jgi:hypothetical protein